MIPGPTPDLRQLVAASLLLSAAVTACRSETIEKDWTVAVDTIDGVVRVVNTPPAGRAQPTLVGREELRIGGGDERGPSSFGLIRSIAVLPDGRIAVGDSQAEEVRLFDGAGRYLRTFGGKGAGPGELDGMQGVYLAPDGLLWVPEEANARMSSFDPDSGFVGSRPFKLWSYGFQGPWEASFDSAGRTLVASAGPYQGGFWNMLRIYDADMSQVDSVPYHDYTEEVFRDRPGEWMIPLGRGQLHVPVPFYARHQEVLTPLGEFWTFAEGTPEVLIRRWTPPGDTTLLVYSRRAGEAITASQRDSAIKDVSSRLSDEGVGTPKLDASKIPGTRPPVYGLSVDDRGRLWVRISGPEKNFTVYDVFQSNGRHAETVRLPFRADGAIPPTVRGNDLWAVGVDDFDVQFVVRVRLEAAVS